MLSTAVEAGPTVDPQRLYEAACAVVEDAPQAVQVLVVPAVNVPPEGQRFEHLQLSDDLIDQIRRHLDERRTLGTWVQVRAPRYVGASVVARIKPVAGHDPAAVRHGSLLRLYQFIDPVRGGPAGDGWPFGLDLDTGMLFQLLRAVPGVARVLDVLLFPADIEEHSREPDAVPAGRLELAPTELFASVRHSVHMQDTL